VARYFVRMPREDHDLDDRDDYADPSDDQELDELTADIASILAGRTVAPAAIMWWRTRRERRAEKEPSSLHWWQL
jgi:hypothetical protein